MVGGVVVFVLGLLFAIIAVGMYCYLSAKRTESSPRTPKAPVGEAGAVNFKEIKQQTHEFRIKYSDLVFGSLLGKGNQGEVFRAKLRSTAVAVKKVDCRKVEPDIIDEFIQEVNIWHRLRNPFITMFMGVCLEYPHLCIVTELVSRGSLFGLLHDEDSALTWPRRVQIASDLARGMNYLHQFDTKDPIIHRDLKSLNVLISAEWRAKVADFGMTRFQDNKNVMTTCGTPLWMAPEIILRKEYDFKVDVYSYGIVLWELYTRKIPYKLLGIPAKYLVKKVAVDFLRPKIPSSCPEIYAKLMQTCWQQNPTHRPTFKDVVQYCDTMVKDPSVMAHQPLHDLSVAKTEAAKPEEQKSIVADFDLGKWRCERNDVKVGNLVEELKGMKRYDGVFKAQDVTVSILQVPKKFHDKLHDELEHISNFRHPHLTLFLGAYFSGDTVGVITKKYKKEDLHHHIVNQKIVLEWETIVQIMIDVCQAMARLHGPKEHHLLPIFNPKKIYLTEHWRAVVDLHTSFNTLEEKNHTISLWSAPETLLNPKEVSEKSHIYSLGLILWQMVTRKMPYNEEKMTKELSDRIIRGEATLDAPDFLSPNLAKLMKRCLALNHSDRGTFEQVLKQLLTIKKAGPPQIVVDEKTAKVYCKMATVFAFRTADPCMVEKDWGKQNGKAGDWIICNPNEDDLYLCDKKVFDRTYEPYDERANQYRKVGTVLGRQMEKPFALKTSDGVQYGAAGDYVVRDARVRNGDLWVVDEKTFKKIYKLVEEEKSEMGMSSSHISQTSNVRGNSSISQARSPTNVPLVGNAR